MLSFENFGVMRVLANNYILFLSKIEIALGYQFIISLA